VLSPSERNKRSNIVNPNGGGSTTMTESYQGGRYCRKRWCELLLQCLLTSKELCCCGVRAQAILRRCQNGGSGAVETREWLRRRQIFEVRWCCVLFFRRFKAGGKRNPGREGGETFEKVKSHTHTQSRVASDVSKWTPQKSGSRYYIAGICSGARWQPTAKDRRGYVRCSENQPSGCAGVRCRV
jgi:hypothetical protein